MFGADVLVVETLGLLIGQRHHLSGPIRKPFEHVHLLLAGTTRPAPHKVGRDSTPSRQSLFRLDSSPYSSLEYRKWGRVSRFPRPEYKKITLACSCKFCHERL